MKGARTRTGLIGIGLVCFLVWLPDIAWARDRFRVGGSIDLGGVIVGVSVGDGHHGRDYGHYGYRRRGYGYGRYRFPSRRYPERYDYGRYGRYGGRRRSGYQVGVDILIYPRVILEKPVGAAPQVAIKKGPQVVRGGMIGLLDQLMSQDSKDRKKAVKGLTKFPCTRTRIALENVLLNDPDEDVREEAAESLGKMGKIASLPALKEAKKNDDEDDVRKEAKKAIKKIKEDRVPVTAPSSLPPEVVDSPDAMGDNEHCK